MYNGLGFSLRPKLCRAGGARQSILHYSAIRIFSIVSDDSLLSLSIMFIIDYTIIFYISFVLKKIYQKYAFC